MVRELPANTDHLDRMIGLPAITFAQVEVPESDFSREASAKTFGAHAVRWKECPFEWVRDKHYAVLRVFENGPFTRFYGGIEFAPGQVGCIVRVFSDITAGTALGVWSLQTLATNVFEIHFDIAMNISNWLRWESKIHARGREGKHQFRVKP